MRTITFMIYLVFASTLPGQVITIKDKTTRMPLGNVEVFNQDKSVQTLSNDKGKADIFLFSQDDTLWFRLAGYPDEVMRVAELKQQKTVYLDDKATVFDVVVYSGTRGEQTKREVSNRIIVIGADQQRMQNPQTMPDMLASSGEVFVQKSQFGGGSPMIRGFATNRLLMSVDGVRMNTAIFRSGNIQNVISLDAFSISRTEVLFGPGSNIYGSDAIGGVMNFYTLKPRFASRKAVDFSGSATTRYASANNERTAHLDFNIGLKKWAFVTSATFSDYDNLVMGSYGPDEYLRKNYVRRINGRDSVMANANPKVQVPTGFSQENLMQKVAYKISNRTELIYAFHWSETSAYSRYDRLIRPRGNTLRSAEWNYGPQKWMMNHLQLLNRRATKFYNELGASAALQHFEESRIDRDLNQATRFTTMEKVKALSFNLDLVKHFGRNRLYYGAEYVRNTVASRGTEYNINTGVSKKGVSRYPDGSEWTSMGIYLNYVHKLGEAFTLQAGARYSQYSLNSTFDTTVFKFPFTTASISHGALTGSVGVNYHPGKTWIIGLSGSTGFRSPNVDDIGKIFESTPGALTVPNPNLQAEYAMNAEMSITKRVSEFLQADITGFYTRLDNALVRRPYRYNGEDSILYQGTMSQVVAIQNAAYAEVYGVQAGFRLNLPEGFSISSRITYTKGYEELDNGDRAPLRHAAPLFGVTHFEYVANKIKFDLYAIYNGQVANNKLAPEEQAKNYMYAIDGNGKPYSPKWTTLNLKMMYQLTSYLTVTSGMENIGDVRYRPYSSGIVAPGRNFILALRAVI